MGILPHTDTIQTRPDTIQTRTDTIRTKTDTRPRPSIKPSDTAYYKGVLRRTDKTKPGKYYPTAVTVGRVTTDELCDEIAEISTVSHADVVAVLKALNRTIGSHLSRGESVQLQGLCNIRLTALSKGAGVDSIDKVSAEQITGYRVVFSAEQKRGAANKGYALNLSNLRWRPLPGNETEAAGGSGSNSGTGGTTPTPGGGSGEDEG